MINFRLCSKSSIFLDSGKTITTQKIKLKDFFGTKSQIDKRIFLSGIGKNQLDPKTISSGSSTLSETFNPFCTDLPESISTSKICDQTISSSISEISHPSLSRGKIPDCEKFTEIFDFGPEASLYSGISNPSFDSSNLASEE